MVNYEDISRYCKRTGLSLYQFDIETTILAASSSVDGLAAYYWEGDGPVIELMWIKDGKHYTPVNADMLNAEQENRLLVEIEGNEPDELAAFRKAYAHQRKNA